jgi:hypothetical protein
MESRLHPARILFVGCKLSELAKEIFINRLNFEKSA